MSASTERKNRAAARAAGTDKKTLAAQEAEQKARKSKRKWIIGTIAVLLCIALVLFLSSPLMYRITTAVSVGDKNYSPAQVKFIRTNARNSLNLGGYTVDYNTVSQYYGEDLADQLLESTALGQMARNSVLLKYARENGISLTPYEKQTVADTAKAQINAIGEAAKMYNVSTSTYMSGVYGAGVNETLIRSMLEEDALANKALFSKYISISSTPEDLASYYTDPIDGDLFSYAYYLVKTDDSRTAEEAQATAEALVSSFTEWRDEGVALDDIAPFVAPEPVEDAEDNAEPAEDNAEPAEDAAEPAEDAAEPAEDAAEPAEDAAEPVEDAAEPAEDAQAVEPEDALRSILTKNFPDETLTVRNEVLGSSLEEITRPWLSEEGRVKGDITTLEAADGAGWYVVLFLDHNDNTEPVVAVRHILIKAEASEDGTYSDEAKAAAKAKADEILAAFNQGDKTEEDFAVLAFLLSEDGGSSSNGGLYSTVEQGQMVKEFDEFCFDESRQPGDTAVVYGESGAYAGYHVTYFVEKLPARDASARDALRSKALNDWSTEITEGIEPVKRWAYKLVD